MSLRRRKQRVMGKIGMRYIDKDKDWLDRVKDWISNLLLQGRPYGHINMVSSGNAIVRYADLFSLAMVMQRTTVEGHQSPNPWRCCFVVPHRSSTPTCCSWARGFFSKVVSVQNHSTVQVRALKISSLPLCIQVNPSILTVISIIPQLSLQPQLALAS